MPRRKNILNKNIDAIKPDENLNERVRVFLNSNTGYATASKIVLAVLALAGITFVMATAPNAFQVFGRFKKTKNYSAKKIKKTMENLNERGYIKILKENDEKIKIKITKKGKKKFKEFSLDALSITKPAKWDKKWRMVIFDIPNKFTAARRALRIKLKNLGFYKLQKSVWVFPYPCQDEILFAANIFGVEKFIEILTVEKLLNENRVLNYFDL